MIKLIQNELIKIFKRKSIYVLLILSLFVIVIYNYINPNQNTIVTMFNSTNDKVLSNENEDLFKDDIELYIAQKNSNYLIKLYNKYQKNSWQRYALNEEFNGNSNQDINRNIAIVNYYNYARDKYPEIKEDDYLIAKEKLEKYEEALDSNDENKYIELKLENLVQRSKEKNTFSFLEYYENIDISVEIELYQFREKYNIGFENDFLNQYIDEYRLEKSFLNEKNNNMSKQEIHQEQERIELIKYALKNKINADISPKGYILIPNNDMNARNLFINLFDNLDVIIIIISIYISTTIITEEFSTGTVKSLLIKPHKRSEILFSKILTCIITIIICMIFVAFTQYIVGGVMFGFDSYNLKYIGYNSKEIFTINLLVYSLLVGISKLPLYIITTLICLCLSVINCNSAMTMTLSLGIFIIGNSVLSLWSEVEKVSKITRYFITNNWDFSKYLFGGISKIDNINLLFSSVIYILYFIALSTIIFKIFDKKEIKNM